MKILNFFTVLCFSFFMISSVHAQKGNPKIRALKIEVVTGEMNLTKDQEARFLPIYNRYSDELLSLYHAKKKIDTKANGMESVNERQRIDQQILDVKKKYKDDFLKIINPTQLANMYKGEEKFKAMLINRLKDHSE